MAGRLSPVRAGPMTTPRTRLCVPASVGYGEAPVAALGRDAPMDVPGSGMDDPFGLAGTRALVTGASGSLGRHFAGLLNAHGADVVIAARRPHRLSQVSVGPGKSAAVAMDVTDAASIARGFEDAEVAFGPINCLVNNAGIATGVGALDLSIDDYDAVMDTNARGAFLGSAGGALDEGGGQGGGRQYRIYPWPEGGERGHANSMSKAAVIQMTHALALNGPLGIRVMPWRPDMWRRRSVRIS